MPRPNLTVTTMLFLLNSFLNKFILLLVLKEFFDVMNQPLQEIPNDEENGEESEEEDDRVREIRMEDE